MSGVQRVPHRAGVWWRRLLAVGFGLVLAGGMAEVIARAYYAWTRHDAAYLVTPLLKTKATGPVQYAFPAQDFYNDEHPGAPHQQGERGVRWYFKIRPGDYPPPEPYAYGSLHINSLGFRGPEFDPENRDGRRRVICIGESSTFGAESPDDQTWPARLESHLRRQGLADVEVINSGFMSAESRNYLNLVKQELLGYRPSLLVLYSGVNDLNFQRNYDAKPANWGFHTFLAMIKGRWSMLSTLLYETLYVPAKQSALTKYMYRRGAVEEYTQHLEELIGLARAHGVPLLVVRQVINLPPELWTDEAATMDEIEARLKQSPADHSNVRYADYAEAYRLNELMAAARDVCRRHGIPMLDIRPEFAQALRGPEPLFFDYVHLTPTGNDVFASLVAPHAAPLLAASGATRSRTEPD